LQLAGALKEKPSRFPSGHYRCPSLLALALHTIVAAATTGDVCWLLSVIWLYESGQRESSFRDTTNLLVLVEPGLGCFEYRVSLAPYLHEGNQTHTSHE
jgi:hypothetical protein